MRSEQIEDVDFTAPGVAADVFWRIADAFDEDPALQMLSLHSRRALAGTISDWMLGGGGRPNYTAVRVNLKHKLANTPFSVFGQPMHIRVTEIVLSVIWPEHEEK